MKCGCCGAGYTVVGRNRVGCAAAREKLSCANHLTVKVDEIELAVINALQTHLMNDDLCRLFCAEYTRRMNELRKHYNASVRGYRAEAAKIERERQQIIKSVTDGVPTELIRDRAIAVQKRREELEVLLAEVKEEPVLFHPNMAKRYHDEIADLVVTLRDPEQRGHSAKLLRSLVDHIVVTPVDSAKRYELDLVGDLAGILSVATGADSAVVAAELSKFEPVEGEREADSELVATEEEPQNSAIPPRQLAMVAGVRKSHELSETDQQPAQKRKTPLSQGFREA